MSSLQTLLSSPARERGQVLLVIVLLMVVILTIGLSLATKNITNLRQSSDEDNSQRAFSAAEAGVQVALQSQNNVPITSFSSTTSYKASISATQAVQFVVNNGTPVLRNSGVDVWLSNFPTYANKWSGPLTVYWGDASNSDPCQSAALEIAVVSGTDLLNPVLRQYAFDPCAAASRQLSNHFASVGSGSYALAGTGMTFKHSVTLSPNITNGLLVRIIPLYANTLVGVSGNVGNPFPVQGVSVESTGMSAGTQRKIVVFQSNPKIPLEIFPNALFTPSAQ